MGDHRVELEGCMTNLDDLASDAHAALDDIIHLNLIKGIQDLGDIIWMLPDAVSSCGELTELQTDLDVVMEWAEIFKHPTQVAKIASKNWLFHGVKVKKDIADEKTAWASGDFFSAGDDTAEALTILVPLDTKVDLFAEEDEYFLY